MRYGRDQAELVKDFAVARGLKVRAAQVHRKNQSPEWTEFCQTRAARKEPTGEESGPPAALEKPDEAKTPEDIMESSAFLSWKAIEREKRLAIQSRDPNVVALCKAEQLAQKSFRDAKRAREQADVAARRLVPLAEVNELRRRFVEPLANLVRNMPAEIGPKANSFDPNFAIQVCEQWLQFRFSPQLAKVDHAFSNYEKNLQPEQ